MTSWSPELVSEKEVPVINEIVVADLHEKLLEEEKNGNLQICRYEYSEDYRKKIASHVVDRLLRFDIDLEHIAEQDKRFSLYYKGIVDALLAVTDGHLMP